jgi:hypothetical protein
MAQRVDDRVIECEDVLGANVDAQTAALASVESDLDRYGCSDRSDGDRHRHLRPNRSATFGPRRVPNGRRP